MRVVKSLRAFIRGGNGRRSLEYVSVVVVVLLVSAAAVTDASRMVSAMFSGIALALNAIPLR
jgi:hypothetical protein